MSERIAIFFDAENISAEYVNSILAKVKSYGAIVIQRAYADWSIPNTQPWKKLVAKQPISVYQQFHNGETQVIDKTIIMDAIQIAIEHPDIDTFCLVASDKGYANLALRLRELGKYVLGIGEEEKAKEDSLLVNACNEFIYVEKLNAVEDTILIDNKDTKKDTAITNFSLSNFIAQAYDSTPKTKEGYVLLSRLGESIRSFKPDFDHADYGYKTFKQMIDAFSNEYEICTDGRPQPSYMIIRREIETVNRRAEGTIQKLVSFFGEINSEGKAFFFYVGDVKKQYRSIKLKTGMKVRFLVINEPVSNPDPAKNRNGRAKEIEIFSEK